MIYIYIDWVNNWISQAKKIPCFLSILLQKIGLGSLTKDMLRGFFQVDLYITFFKRFIKIYSPRGFFPDRFHRFIKIYIEIDDFPS